MGFYKKILNLFTSENNFEPIDLNGEWKGFYKYNQRMPHHLSYKSTYFVIDIESDGNDFSGKVTEELLEGNIDNEITVYGQLLGSKISFHKIYDSTYILDESGGYAKMMGIQSPLITYKGRFYKLEGKFVGSWNMKYELNNMKHSTSGLWEMKKIN